MIDIDPPTHTRLWRLVSKLFIRSAVAQYEPFVREQARLVLDRARPKGEFDFVERSPESCRSGSSLGSWASRTPTYLCASTWATR
jgi:hypothetical protein